MTVGDLAVVPFPVAAGRPGFDTVGLAVSGRDSTVVWMPDVERVRPDTSGGAANRNTEPPFVEGSPLVREGRFEAVDFEGR